MEMYLIEINSLMNLINSFAKKKMPIKIAFKLNQLIVELEKHDEFYRNKATEIIQEFGKKDENDELILTEDKKGYKIQEGRELECNAQLNELAGVKATISDDIFFTLEELENLEVNLQEMHLLSKFIK